MLTTSVIARKRDGYELTNDQIVHMIRGFTSGEIADYQMSAFAMAVTIRGMSDAETSTLTAAMTASGQRMARTSRMPRLDKHSTGGLGDKVSLVLAPLLATMNVCVPMISGRGLGITGGTLDKLESIPGFRTDLNESEFNRVLDECGCVISGATAQIAPADRHLYALRDVTATVPSRPLIVASILSKKLAANLDALIMDVKCGSGAFMRSQLEAKSLADGLVSVGTQSGLPTLAVLSDMDQPLGRAVGNAVEVNEAIAILKRQSNDPIVRRVEHLTIELCTRLLVSIGNGDDDSTDQPATKQSAGIRQKLRDHLDNGMAWERFERMVHLQGGDLNAMQKSSGGSSGASLLVAAKHPVDAVSDGHVESIDSVTIGECVLSLGGGRRKMDDVIDHTVGIEMLVQIGDKITSGQPVANVLCPADSFERCRDALRDAIRIVARPVPHRPVLMHEPQ